MAEPALYEIFDHEAKLLAERLHPKRVLLNMDEIRMGGTCQACRRPRHGRAARRVHHAASAESAAVHAGVEVLIWSDMLDPNHNAHGNYYLVSGDFTGSWRHVPKDLVMAVWGGKPQEKNSASSPTRVPDPGRLLLRRRRPERREEVARPRAANAQNRRGSCIRPGCASMPCWATSATSCDLAETGRATHGAGCVPVNGVPDRGGDVAFGARRTIPEVVHGHDLAIGALDAARISHVAAAAVVPERDLAVPVCP